MPSLTPATQALTVYKTPSSSLTSLSCSHAPSSTSPSNCAKITSRSHSLLCSTHSLLSSPSTPFTIPLDLCRDCKLLKAKDCELQDLQDDKVYLMQQNCELGERCEGWSAKLNDMQDNMQQMAKEREGDWKRIKELEEEIFKLIVKNEDLEEKCLSEVNEVKVKMGSLLEEKGKEQQTMSAQENEIREQNAEIQTLKDKSSEHEATISKKREDSRKLQKELENSEKQNAEAIKVNPQLPSQLDVTEVFKRMRKNYALELKEKILSTNAWWVEEITKLIRVIEHYNEAGVQVIYNDVGMPPTERSTDSNVRDALTDAEIQHVFKIFKRCMEIVHPRLPQELEECNRLLTVATEEHDSILQKSTSALTNAQTQNSVLQEKINNLETLNCDLEFQSKRLQEQVDALPEKIKVATKHHYNEAMEQLNTVQNADGSIRCVNCSVNSLDEGIRVDVLCTVCRRKLETRPNSSDRDQEDFLEQSLSLTCDLVDLLLRFAYYTNANNALSYDVVDILSHISSLGLRIRSTDASEYVGVMDRVTKNSMFRYPDVLEKVHDHALIQILPVLRDRKHVVALEKLGQSALAHMDQFFDKSWVEENIEKSRAVRNERGVNELQCKLEERNERRDKLKELGTILGINLKNRRGGQEN